MRTIVSPYTLFKRFLGGIEGSLGITVAILVPVLMLTAGAAVEYSNIARHKSHLQDYLDAALLDSIWVNGYENSVETTKKRIYSNPKFEDAIITKLELKENPDNTVELAAKVKLEVPLAFGSLFGYDKIEFENAATVSAIKKLTDVKFKPISAKGWYPKKVELIVKRPGGAETVLSTMYYKVQASKPICDSSGQINLTDCGELELGEYEKAYLRFSVWEHGGHINHGGPPPTIVLVSDDPNNARRFFIDGTQQVDGTSVDVFSGLGCDKTSHHAWEDQRVVTLGDTRDFVYRVTGYCKDVDPTKITLIQ